MIKEVEYEPTLAPFEYRVIGPAMQHNYYCSVCRENVAVIDQSTGILQPCWDCQKRNYSTVKLNWFQKLFIK